VFEGVDERVIASRREVGEKAHLLISAVRYETHGRARKGVAIGFYLAPDLR
jgi:sulfite reductase (NADPH) flavoprotein alpha-component